jgi:hypothetical protein
MFFGCYGRKNGMPPDDRYTIANILDDRKIMANKEKCHAALLLQIDKQIQDLRLNRNVKGGDRLVENNEFWIECKRARNPDTLSLAAGELWCAAASAASAALPGSHTVGLAFGQKRRSASAIPQSPKPPDIIIMVSLRTPSSAAYTSRNARHWSSTEWRESQPRL